MRAYVDADVLIWHLRVDSRAVDFLRGLKAAPDWELWIGAMQRGEILFHMRPDEEDGTLLLLSQFRTAPVDQTVIDKAAALYRRWNPSHGVERNDAILAATAMETGGTIFTLNHKHYPVPGLQVRKAW